MLGKTAQLRIAGPGVKVHCQSFAYGALQNGYGRAPQSGPRRQHGRQRTDDDDREPAYKEELPRKNHGQAVDKRPVDHSCAQPDQSGATCCDDNARSHHDGAVQYGYSSQLLRVRTSN